MADEQVFLFMVDVDVAAGISMDSVRAGVRGAVTEALASPQVKVTDVSFLKGPYELSRSGRLQRLRASIGAKAWTLEPIAASPEVLEAVRQALQTPQVRIVEATGFVRTVDEGWQAAFEMPEGRVLNMFKAKEPDAEAD